MWIFIINYFFRIIDTFIHQKRRWSHIFDCHKNAIFYLYNPNCSAMFGGIHSKIKKFFTCMVWYVVQFYEAVLKQLTMISRNEHGFPIMLQTVRSSLQIGFYILKPLENLCQTWIWVNSGLVQVVGFSWDIDGPELLKYVRNIDLNGSGELKTYLWYFEAHFWSV